MGKKIQLSPPRICCVLPCYNVADTCGDILLRALSHGQHVIAINDGSKDETAVVLNKIAQHSGGRVQIISFSKNRGKGAALLAGFQFALEKISFDVLVTIDADGQHEPDDIPPLANACVSGGAALIIGKRAFAAMPWKSRLGNELMSALVRSRYPSCPRDTQSGLRAMNFRFVEMTVKSIKPRRYETELQMLLLALEHQLPINTIAIKTIYLDRNRLSHFRPVKDSLRIYWALLRWRISRFRNTAVSKTAT